MRFDGGWGRDMGSGGRMLLRRVFAYCAAKVLLMSFLWGDCSCSIQLVEATEPAGRMILRLNPHSF